MKLIEMKLATEKMLQLRDEIEEAERLRRSAQEEQIMQLDRIVTKKRELDDIWTAMHQVLFPWRY